MAAIGSIRKQSGLLIALIGIAMLLFLLGDIFSSGTSFFTQEDQNVGNIAGEEISLKEFELRVQNTIDEQFGVEGAGEQARQRIRDRVWQEMIRERVLNRELKKLGLGVSQDELLDQIKNIKPNSVLYQYFTDPNTGQIIEQFRDEQTGGLSSDRVIQAIQNLLNSENAKDWLAIEQAMEQDVIMGKYTNLLTPVLLSNSVAAKQIGKENQATVSFNYVVKEFSSIPNDQVEPTDDDLQTYFDAHKNEERFQLDEESRSVSVAMFELQPTEEDINDLRTELLELIPSFVADSNDTAFVGENADNRPEMLIRYQSIDEVEPQLKDTLPNAEIGSVFGPIENGASMRIVKFSGIKMEPDSVRASHILINIQDGDTAKISSAEALLDSLKNVAQENDNFAELATEYSEDFGSAEKGGDLDWFARGMMVAPFEKAAFNGEVGDMTMITSQFGVHLIHITDMTEPRPQYLLSSVDRIVEPSKATTDAVYKKASRYALAKSNASDITVDEEGDFMVETFDEIRLTDPAIGQVEEAREIIKWLFDAEEGDVSSPFETDRFFVVAGLNRVNPEGLMQLEQARNMIYTEVMNKKKADLIISELGEYSSLADASSKFEVSMVPANDVTFSQGSLPGGLGREMKVLGRAFSLEKGKASKPIVGNRGVYVIEVKSINESGEVDLATVKRNESSSMATRVNAKVYDALQKSAGVDDKRARYY